MAESTQCGGDLVKENNGRTKCVAAGNMRVSITRHGLTVFRRRQLEEFCWALLQAVQRVNHDDQNSGRWSKQRPL